MSTLNSYNAFIRSAGGAASTTDTNVKEMTDSAFAALLDDARSTSTVNRAPVATPRQQQQKPSTYFHASPPRGGGGMSGAAGSNSPAASSRSQNQQQHPMSHSAFSSLHNPRLGSFAAWLGDSMYALYGLHFKKAGFDSVEILRSLTEQQIDVMFRECLPRDLPTGHRFLILNKIDELKKMPRRATNGPHAVVATAASPPSTTSAPAAAVSPIAARTRSAGPSSSSAARTTTPVKAVAAAAVSPRAGTPSATAARAAVARRSTTASVASVAAASTSRPTSPAPGSRSAGTSRASSAAADHAGGGNVIRKPMSAHKSGHHHPRPVNERPKWVGSKGPTAAQLARHVPGSPSAAVISPPRPFILNHHHHNPHAAAANSRANSPSAVAPAGATPLVYLSAADPQARLAQALEAGRARKAEAVFQQQMADTYVLHHHQHASSARGTSSLVHAAATTPTTKHASRPHAVVQHPPRAVPTTRVDFSSYAPLASSVAAPYGGTSHATVITAPGAFENLVANLHHPPPSAGILVSPPRPRR